MQIKNLVQVMAEEVKKMILRLVNGLAMAFSTGTVVGFALLMTVSKTAAEIAWVSCGLLGMCFDFLGPRKDKMYTIYLRIQSGTLVTAIIGWIVIIVVATKVSNTAALIAWGICFLIGMYFDPVGKKEARDREYESSRKKYSDDRSRDRYHGWDDYDRNYVLLDDLYSADYNKIDGFDNDGDDGDY
ncbi:MAG: hypothetical protein Q4E87_00735 [bacterium]|nr:hypothetical protein [bacterium]